MYSSRYGHSRYAELRGTRARWMTSSRRRCSMVSAAPALLASSRPASSIRCLTSSAGNSLRPGRHGLPHPSPQFEISCLSKSTVKSTMHETLDLVSQRGANGGLEGTRRGPRRP